MTFAQRARLSVPALVVAIAVSPAGGAEDSASALGVDWRLEARLSETLETETNQPLDATSDGAIFGSTTRLGVSLQGRTKRSVFDLEAALVGAEFGGSSDADNLDLIAPDLSAGFTYRGKTYTLDAGASFSIRSASDAQVDDTGVTNVNARQFTGAFDVGAGFQATASDNFRLGLSGRIVDFDGAAGQLTPSRSIGANFVWSRAATRTTTTSLSTGYRYFTADNAENSSSDAFDLTLGLQHQRTSRHTVGLNAGLTGVFSRSDIQAEDFQVGFNGGASFDYRGADWNAGLNLSQSVDDSSEGELSAFTRLGGDVRYAVNSRSSLGLTAQASRRSDISGGGDIRNFLSVGPTYSRQLTRDTGLTLGYAFEMDDETGASVQTSHRVFLTLSSNFVLMP